MMLGKGSKHILPNGGELSLSIQVCPKKGISPTILFWGWDLDHQSYSRDGSGFLGYDDESHGTIP